MKIKLNNLDSKIVKEMFRVLKDGGTVRTVWPSMDFIDYLKIQDLLDQAEETAV